MPPRKRKQPRGVVTPLKSFRPYPPDVWDRVKAKAEANGETVTDVLNRALLDYDRRHTLKEPRPAPPDTPTQE